MAFMTKISSTQQNVTPFEINQTSSEKIRKYSFIKAGASALAALVSATAIAVILKSVAIGGIVLASLFPPTGLVIACIGVVAFTVMTYKYIKTAQYHSPERVQERVQYRETLRKWDIEVTKARKNDTDVATQIGATNGER